MSSVAVGAVSGLAIDAVATRTFPPIPQPKSLPGILRAAAELAALLVTSGYVILSYSGYLLRNGVQFDLIQSGGFAIGFFTVEKMVRKRLAALVTNAVALADSSLVIPSIPLPPSQGGGVDPRYQQNPIPSTDLGGSRINTKIIGSVKAVQSASGYPDLSEHPDVAGM